MPKVTQTNIGSVFLKEVEPRKWRASWTDPLTKKHIRRVLPAATFKEAEKQAQAINAELAQGKGFSGRQRGGLCGHTVSDAIIEMIKHSDANEETRANYLWRANHFLAYLATHCKGISSWSAVTHQIVGNYHEFCRQQKTAHRTLGHRILVIKMTSKYMCRTYPGQYFHVAEHAKVKRPPETAKADILSPAELRELIAWLKENTPMVHVWAVLEGLCGLRQREAAYLREQDINFRELTITVAENSAHTPKTQASFRTIPIPAVVAEALSFWIDGLKIRHPEGYLFTPQYKHRHLPMIKRATRAGAFSLQWIAKLWGKTLSQAKSDHVSLPGTFVAYKLRASFVTAMRKAGADFADLQAYIGHTPSTILSMHYDHLEMSRLKNISSLAQDLYLAKGKFSEEKKSAKTEGLLH